jgi:sugar O-acyltransferase (sialic acid O-acetyltransferase NeuD family)
VVLTAIPKGIEMARKPLLVAGATSPDFLKTLHAINRVSGDGYNLRGFLEIDESLIDTKQFGFPVLAEWNVSPETHPDHEVFVNIAHTMVAKRNATDALINRGFTRFASMFHPDVDLTDVTAGEGSIILQGSNIGPFAQIGDHCTVLMGVNLNHECRVADFSFLGPGAILLGRVTGDEGIYVGGGAVIMPGVHLGEGCMVGAGTVIRKDVPPWTVVAGNPARQVRQIPHD